MKNINTAIIINSLNRKLSILIFSITLKCVFAASYYPLISAIADSHSPLKSHGLLGLFCGDWFFGI